MPHLNDSIDVFARKALEANLPITLINHSTAPHAFDLLDDGDSSRNVIANILEFLRLQLAAPMRESLPSTTSTATCLRSKGC